MALFSLFAARHWFAFRFACRHRLAALTIALQDAVLGLRALRWLLLPLLLTASAKADYWTADASFSPTLTEGGSLPATVHFRQPDGRILAAGRFTFSNGTLHTANAGVVRLLADGSLDSSFTPALPTYRWIEQIALQPSGKILLFGGFSSDGENYNGVIRLESNGATDPTFMPITEALYVSAIDAAGRIYGFVDGVVTLKRFLADGQPDTSFQATGVTGVLQAIEPLANGDVLVVRNIVAENAELIRLKNDGTIDPTFAPLGLYNLFGMVVLPDSRALICTGAHTGGRAVVARVLPADSTGGSGADFDFFYQSRPTFSSVFDRDIQLSIAGILLDVLREASPNATAKVWADFSNNALSMTVDCRTDGELIFALTPGNFGADFRRYLRSDATTPSVAPGPFIIGLNPTSLNLRPLDSSVNIYVSVDGIGPFRYEWFKDGVSLGAPDHVSLSLYPLRAEDAGAYSVKVTNAFNNVTSNAVTLTVDTAHSAARIVTQPQDQAVNAGDTATFTVSATGNPAPTYQWYHNENTLSGKTSATLTLTNVAPSAAGEYFVSVSNTVVNGAGSFGSSRQSERVTLTVTGKLNQNAPVIASPNNFHLGSAYTAAASSGHGVVEWALASGSTAPGAAINSSTGAVTCTGTGLIKIEARFLGNSDYDASAYSDTFNITVNQAVATFSLNQDSFTYNGSAQGPNVVASPSNATFSTGGTLSATNAGNYTATATATGNYTGANNSLTWSIAKAAATVTLGNLAASYDGTPKAITATTNPAGKNVTVTYDGSGTAPTAIGSYAVVATINETNYSGSASGTLVITDNPVITAHSATRNVIEPGEDLALSVSVAATGTPTYQWYHNCRAITGATTSSLALTDATHSHEGAYWVTITNAAGTLRSPSMFVLVAPAITEVIAWGSNYVDRATPPAGLTDAISISAGEFFSMALKRNGTVVGWGEATVFSDWSAIVAIAAGQSGAIALKSDGTVVSWNSIYAVPNGLGNVIAISAGLGSFYALKQDGTVVAWGLDNFSQTVLPPDLANVIKIDAGGAHVMAVKSNGTIVPWGANYSGQSDVPAGLDDVIAVDAAYGSFSLALKNDGTVAAWGLDMYGQLSVPEGLANVIAVAGGGFHSLALRNDGSVVGWGRNLFGESSPPFVFSSAIAIAASNGYSVVLRDATNDLAPTISTHPASQSRDLAQSVTFTVTASGGTAPLTYQWRKGGVNISGATASSLTLSNLVLADAGAYDVVVSNYLGSATSNAATLSVNRIPTTFTLSYANRTYNSSPQGPTINATPSNATFTVGGTTSATDAGNYTATATATGNYIGTNNSLTWTIEKGTVGVILENLSATYDGTPKSATATTIPSGLTVTYTYDGSSIPPTNAGSYQVFARVNHANYEGMTLGTLVIAKATQTAVTITSAASGTFGTSYTATATGGSGSGALVWSLGTGSTAPGAAINASTGAVTSTGAGTVVIKVYSAADANYNASATTVDFTITLAKATATVTLGGLSAVFDGTAKAATATTDPAGKTVNITYNGAPTAPTNPGSYTVTATINDANYIGSASDTLVITDNGPVFTSYSATRKVIEPGGDLNLALTLAAINPLAYQWYHNGRPISGAIGTDLSPSLSVANADYANQGAYWVVVTGVDGNNTPVTVRSAPMFVLVAPALTQIVKWGYGDVTGSYHPPAGVTDTIALAASELAGIALKRDGTLWAWGHSLADVYSLPSGLDAVVAIAGGSEHALALKSDGDVVGWGYNYSGQTTVPADLHNVVAVAAGGSHSLALRTDGTVAAWGSNSVGQATIPAGLTDVIAIAAGGLHSLALKSDRTVVAWGYNLSGQSTVPSGLNDVVAISAGSEHSVALKSDGTVVSWGSNSSQQLNHPSSLANVSAIYARSLYSLALKTDGTVNAWGYDGAAQNTIASGLSGVIALSGEGNFALALRSVTLPVISAHPANQSKTTGQTATFSVTATGYPAPTYQWQVKQPGESIWSDVGNGDYSGAQSSTLTVAGVVVSRDSGDQYRCVISNFVGSAASNEATLTVGTPLPVSSDFNGDGHSDILWQNTNTGERYVWFMNGVTHTGGASLGAIDVAWSVAGTADFNADSHPDILWQNTKTGERQLWLMKGTTHTHTIAMDIVDPVWSIAGVGDLNRDGNTDIVWQNTSTGERYLWLMDGTSRTDIIHFGTVDPVWSIATVTDYDSDGDPDLLWQNTSSGERYLWLMDGTSRTDLINLGTVDPTWSVAGPTLARTTGSFDFNDDGHPDVLWQNTSTGERYLWLMDGATHVGGADLGTVDPDWSIAGIGDLNGDGDTDIVWQNTSTGERYIWLMNGTSHVGGADLGTVDPVWFIVAVADFNGDRSTDILWQNTSTGERYLWLMNGTTHVGGADLGTVDPVWSIAGVGDLNGDGDTDIVWQNTSTGERYLWLMDGTTHTSGADLGAVDPVWSIAAVADFNGDRSTDILWQNTSTGERYLWLMDGTTRTNIVNFGLVDPLWQIVN